MSKKELTLKELSIKKALGDDEQKIGVSLKMPSSLKSKLQDISNENNITLSSLIVATLRTVYEDK